MLIDFNLEELRELVVAMRIAADPYKGSDFATAQKKILEAYDQAEELEGLSMDDCAGGACKL